LWYSVFFCLLYFEITSENFVELVRGPSEVMEKGGKGGGVCD